MAASFMEFEDTARQQGFERIAGIDEAGRGPLAGPVVSAAVVLPRGFAPGRIDDSKKLSPGARTTLYERIYAEAVSVGIGIVDAVVIDRINILKASLLSMALAVENLSPGPDFLLVDGNREIPSELAQRAVVGGDAKSVSIAAASIVAKVTRDRMMMLYDLDYPEFGFRKNKGYPTRGHKEAITAFGICPIHRKSFNGVVPRQKKLWGGAL